MVLDLTTQRARFPSEYQSVGKARQAVGHFAVACGFAGPEVSDVVLAVGEACSNAVEHGHVEQGEFLIECSYHEGVLRVEISDNGCGFDGSDRNGEIDAAECVGRGRGIPIMRALMDRIAYRRTKTGTTVVLEKRMSPRGVGETNGEVSRLDAGGRG